MQLVALIKHKWFYHMIEDIKDLITEATFTARWTIIEAYHSLGLRILQEKGNFEKSGIKDERIIETVAKAIGKSERTVYYAVEFAQRYPTLNMLPEGKNTSWHRIVNQYLPKSKKTQQDKGFMGVIEKCLEKIQYSVTIYKEDEMREGIRYLIEELKKYE